MWEAGERIAGRAVVERILPARGAAVTALLNIVDMVVVVVKEWIVCLVIGMWIDLMVLS